MNELKEEDIVNSYKKIRFFAEQAFNNADYENCLQYIELAANVAYNFNIFYKDDILEGLLIQISKIVLPEVKITSLKSDRLVFYDFFGIANRGLTQQYLRAIMSWDYEFLYILESPGNHADLIINEIKAYGKAEIFIVNPKLFLFEKIRLIFEIVNKYKPSKAFLHMHPASVVGVIVWNSLSCIERYQINLTDHAFWLGVNSFDYCLEFRQYGCNVSLQKRGISLDKLLLQPFYPITECNDFEGLPSIPDNKILIFTGGAYYKMYGDNGLFFEVIRRLLNENSEIIFILAGTGDERPFRKFIRTNRFENRIYLIGNRSDINYVFQKCDIYLSTFPITGGLMAQLAAVNSKPILAYSTKDIPCNDVESFLYHHQDINKKKKLTYYDLQSFYDNAKTIINDEAYRREIGLYLKEQVLSEASFNSLLYENVFNKKNMVIVRNLDIDYKRFYNLYIEVENKFLYTYRLLLLSNFKLASIYSFPKETFSVQTLIILFLLVKRKLKKMKRLFFKYVLLFII